MCIKRVSTLLENINPVIHTATIHEIMSGVIVILSFAAVTAQIVSMDTPRFRVHLINVD